MLTAWMIEYIFLRGIDNKYSAPEGGLQRQFSS